MLLPRKLPALLYVHCAPLNWIRGLVAAVKMPLQPPYASCGRMPLPVNAKRPGIRRHG
jgi:hypothetical protein